MAIKIISAALLLVSGLMITLAGAFFSVKGVVMLIPDPEIFYGLFVLAIAFEAAKITASTFLFHEARDRRCPVFLKAILVFAVGTLIALSAIATYSHLNSSISKSMGATQSMDSQLERLTEDRDRLQGTIRNIENQIESLPANTRVANRIQLIKTYTAEKQEAKQKLDKIETELRQLEGQVVQEDKFLFLNSLSKLTGMNRDDLYTAIVLAIVVLIDPLAITLILSGTFVIAMIREERSAMVAKDAEIERLREVEEKLEEDLGETTEQLIDRVEDSIEKNNGNISADDIKAILQIEQNKEEVPPRIRKKLIRIRDFLKDGTNDTV